MAKFIIRIQLHDTEHYPGAYPRLHEAMAGDFYNVIPSNDNVAGSTTNTWYELPDATYYVDSNSKKTSTRDVHSKVKKIVDQVLVESNADAVHAPLVSFILVVKCDANDAYFPDLKKSQNPFLKGKI